MRTETKASPEAFKSVSSFTKKLPYHDPTKHAFADNAHTLANFVKQVTGMIGDLARKGTRIFRPKHRKNELKTKRFAYMKSQAGTAPVRPKWQATKARVKLIEDAQALCKRPKEWPSLGPMFSKEVKKTSELLLCAGPVGAYYLQYVDIDDDIKANMIKVFRLMRHPAAQMQHFRRPKQSTQRAANCYDRARVESANVPPNHGGARPGEPHGRHARGNWTIPRRQHA